MIFHTPRNTCALAGMLSVFLTVLTLSCLSAQAQDMNAYSSGRGSDTSNRSPASMGVPSYQDTVEFLTQKARQEERERVAEENRRQSFRNRGSGRESRRDYDFGPLSTGEGLRQYGR